MIGPDNTDSEILNVFSKFFDEKPAAVKITDTGRGDEDFRNTAIVDTEAGNRYVLKIAANDFTFPEKIRMWARTVEEYRALGYYCPKILSDKNGEFPVIRYHDRQCVAYAEEFAKYRSFEERLSGDGDLKNADTGMYSDDIWSMTAKIAALHLDYTEAPSAWCLFTTFCPSDKTDEVLENALEWKKLGEALPAEFTEQVERIWKLWCVNREALEKIYHGLPTSVFQADLNSTNLLIDEEGRFRGVLDFNLCGREVFLNYLMRENYDSFEKEIDLIKEALMISKRYYTFSEEEKQAALPLYRCLKPLWWTSIQDLKDAGDDREAVKKCLDRSEYYLTTDIDFRSCME